MTRDMKMVVGGSAAALLVLGGGFFLYKKHYGNIPPDFETEAISKGRIIGKVSATGTLSALVTVQVGTQVTGRIDKLFADFNSQVKKGQVVAEIDPLLFQAAVENSRANLAQNEGLVLQAKVKAAVDRKAAVREKALLAQNLVAQQDLDNAEALADEDDAAYAAALGNRDQAKASLDTAKLNLFYTKITSPINGTVVSRAVDVGQTVAASLSAPTIFTIAEDLTKIQVDTSVAEADVGRLAAGMTATFFVDAYPNIRFKGIVRQIRLNATTVQNVVTYDAVIDVDNPEQKLLPGMTATVTYVYADKDDVLSIPNTALRFHPPADLVIPEPGSHGGHRVAGSHDHGDHEHGEHVGGNWQHGDHGGKDKDSSKLAAADTPAGTKSDALPPMALTSSHRASSSSVADGPHMDYRKIYVLDETGTKLKTITIHTGITDGTNTEILDPPEGLGEGSAVVTTVTRHDKPAAGGQQPPGGMRRMF